MGSLINKVELAFEKVRSLLVKKRTIKLRKTRTPASGRNAPHRKKKVKAFELKPQAGANLKKKYDMNDIVAETEEQKRVMEQIKLEKRTLQKMILLFQYFPKAREMSHENIAGHLNVDRTTVSHVLAEVKKVGILLGWDKESKNYRV